MAEGNSEGFDRGNDIIGLGVLERLVSPTDGFVVSNSAGVTVDVTEVEEEVSDEGAGETARERFVLPEFFVTGGNKGDSVVSVSVCTPAACSDCTRRGNSFAIFTPLAMTSSWTFLGSRLYRRSSAAASEVDRVCRFSLSKIPKSSRALRMNPR